MATSELDSTNLRVRTARGTIINAAFRAGLAVLGLINRVAVAAFLTRDEYGLWGIMLAVLFTLFWLKQVGIQDKYIQQREPDQELAFQKAFTLELALSFGVLRVCCLALPIYAVAYGHDEIILPGLVLATAVVLTSFQTPAWIPYRRMQYARERALLSVDPVVSFIGMVGLAVAGFGYWGLVVGVDHRERRRARLVCVTTSPYRLRIRFDRGDRAGVRELLVAAARIGTQPDARRPGIAARREPLARPRGCRRRSGSPTNFAAFADRVNAIVSQTIYPAVCRVVDRGEALLRGVRQVQPRCADVVAAVRHRPRPVR